jgi:catechol 2,3-dioxygenase-like lactoylglutathione lyase family enzyme
MIKLSSVQVWVHDQDEALAFYTDKLGWEVREDVTLPEIPDFRWLSVGPPEQKDIAIVLMAVPGAPVFEEDTRQKILDIMGRGASGGIFLTTDDCHAAYEQLKARGVEFSEEPSDRPYGVDAGFHDASGNAFRLVQPPTGGYN